MRHDARKLVDEPLRRIHVRRAQAATQQLLATELVARQAEHWDPLLDWASQRYDIAFTRVTGIMHKPQPEATPLRLATALLACSPWQLAALNPIISIAGSLVLALAIV